MKESLLTVINWPTKLMNCYLVKIIQPHNFNHRILKEKSFAVNPLFRGILITFLALEWLH